MVSAVDDRLDLKHFCLNLSSKSISLFHPIQFQASPKGLWSQKKLKNPQEKYTYRYKNKRVALQAYWILDQSILCDFVWSWFTVVTSQSSVILFDYRQDITAMFTRDLLKRYIELSLFYQNFLSSRLYHEDILQMLRKLSLSKSSETQFSPQTQWPISHL